MKVGRHMKDYLKAMAAVVTALMLCSCAPPSPQAAALPASDIPMPSQTPQPAPRPPSQSATPSKPTTPTVPSISTTPTMENTGNSYIRGLVDTAVSKLDLEGKDDFGQVQAAYEYIIANTYFAPPLGLDSWQLHDGVQPNYIENRALSPLAYGIGSCEDYACAMAEVLRALGFEARYVPGITISVRGDFVDHAWTAVRIHDDWYHLDPQLEDNIMRNGLLRYRYFLKTDKEMLVDHRWGKNLIEYAQLTGERKREVEREYILPVCDRQYPAVNSRELKSAPVPNIGMLTSQIADEREAYEAEYGKLPAITLKVTPPVFGNAGYGPPD